MKDIRVQLEAAMSSSKGWRAAAGARGVNMAVLYKELLWQVQTVLRPHSQDCWGSARLLCGMRGERNRRT